MEQVRIIDGETMVLCVNVQCSMFNVQCSMRILQYSAIFYVIWSESCTYRHVIQRISHQS